MFFVIQKIKTRKKQYIKKNFYLEAIMNDLNISENELKNL